MKNFTLKNQIKPNEAQVFIFTVVNFKLIWYNYLYN